FEIQHRKGTSHGNTDALSRRPCKERCKHCTNAEKKFGMETDISVKVLTTEDAWSSSKWESDDGSSCRWQLILPKSRIQEVLRETHDSASGGHFGVMKLWAKPESDSIGIDFAPTSKNGAENATLAEPEKDPKQ
ncbi:hypothetical protein AVEN_5323-1, partial [Araneus ventricosus]